MAGKLEYLLKHNKFAQKTYVVVCSFGFRVLGLFVKKNRKKVLIQSLIGKNYGDSPKVLYDAMRANEHFKDYEYVWAFDDPSKFEVEGAKKVKLTSIQYYLEALTSGIWISNVSIERGLKFKPKETIYLNTWHGIPIKVIGNSQKTRDDYDYSSIDFMCCSSEFEKKIFIRDFNIKEETIVQCGMPRNDELYHPSESVVQTVRKELKIPDDKKIILYAPTWRDSTDGGSSYQIAPPMNLEHWKDILGGEYVLLFRMHHLTTKLMGVQFNDFVRDVSNYPQINNLMIAADILISDYSATIFDYSILEKPIISFAYDLEEYSNVRGFYEQLDKDVLPGDVFKTENEIIQHIQSMDYAAECKRARHVKEKYVNVAGNATKACIDFLINQTTK